MRMDIYAVPAWHIAVWGMGPKLCLECVDPLHFANNSARIIVE